MSRSATWVALALFALIATFLVGAEVVYVFAPDPVRAVGAGVLFAVDVTLALVLAWQLRRDSKRGRP